MTQKLIQKHWLHGTHVYELKDDFVRVTHRSRVKGEKVLDIELAMLNPQPVTSQSQLHFHSRVKCGPLISLHLNKPNAKEFTAFVEAVSNRADNQFNAFAGLKQP